jgi:hypothetical protein
MRRLIQRERQAVRTTIAHSTNQIQKSCLCTLNPKIRVLFPILSLHQQAQFGHTPERIIGAFWQVLILLWQF